MDEYNWKRATRTWRATSLGIYAFTLLAHKQAASHHVVDAMVFNETQDAFRVRVLYLDTVDEASSGKLFPLRGTGTQRWQIVAVPKPLLECESWNEARGLMDKLVHDAWWEMTHG